MTMLHDTFCTPSTFDKQHLINETTCTNNNHTTLRVDTLFRPSSNNCNTILPPPSLRSSNSSLTTVSSSSSSNDELSTTDDDYHKLARWVQRQLGFYTALSILPPRFPCIDDGKLLLCLIHRFAPHFLPRLVTTLEQHTAIECHHLADELAQQLWRMPIESLAIHLYRHYHNTSMITLADYADSLLLSPPPSSSSLPSPFSSTSTTPDDEEQLPCNDDDDTEDDDAQPHAVINATTTHPICQHHRPKNNSYYTRWIAATHQSIDSYLHHPHTSRFSVLLSLLDQLAGIYVGFTRLTAAATPPDYLLPTRQLLARLQLMDDSLANLPITTKDDDNKVDDHSFTSLSDILVQQHAQLLMGAQQATDIFEKASKVQTWVAMQQNSLASWTQGGLDTEMAWLDDVQRYRQEDQDVLALVAHISSSASPFSSFGRLMARVTKPMVIKALDCLDELVAQSKQVMEQQLRRHSLVTDWESMSMGMSTRLETLHNSIQQLIQRATITSDNNNNNIQESHRSLRQQWKILSDRVARMEYQGDYNAIAGLYQKMVASGTSSSMATLVETRYTSLAQLWTKISGSLDLARQRIALYQRIESFLHQCHLVQINATDLAHQLDSTSGGGNIYDKQWMGDQVSDLDKTIAQVVDFSTGDSDDGDHAAGLVRHWKDVLLRCQMGYHQAWVVYQSKCARLERQRELEAIKSAINGQLDILESSLFDPWTLCVDDVGGLKRGHVERKRHFRNTVVIQFDQWIKSGGDEQQQQQQQQQQAFEEDLRTRIETGQQLLTDYDHRLTIFERRFAWEQQWRKASMQIQQTTNDLYAMVDSHDDSNTTINDIRSHVWGCKRTFERLQHSLDNLLVLDSNGQTSNVMDRICQRQQILADQVDELDGFLEATLAALDQKAHVDLYTASVDGILKTSHSVGRRLEANLLTPDGDGGINEQEQVGALAMATVKLWQHAGSQIPYPNSFLAVDDLVRWKVMVAYGNVMAAVAPLVVDGLEALSKRTDWETRWQLDMDGLTQAQQHLSLWLQQLDHGTGNLVDGDTATIVDRYTEYPFHTLENYFTAMQEAYPVNLKIPLALKERQQQLTVDTYGHIKSLCGLVTYLQTARQIEDTCDHMNATLDQEGVKASEDMVQQWTDETKMYVELELFASLCGQQIQLQDGVDAFGKEKVRMVRDKVSKMLGNLQDRLATTLKASQHARLIQAYGESATVLESSLQQLQGDLTSLTDELDKMTHNFGGAVYQDHEKALHTKWEEAKLSLDTIYAGSYNDVRCLCQLIQLQQVEPDVAARQSRLDDLGQTVWRGLTGVQDQILSLAQWRDVSSSLDKVQAMLGPLAQWMDRETMAIHDDMDHSKALDVLSRIYREAHASLAAIRGVNLSCGTDASLIKTHLMHRLDSLCHVVDGLRTALACSAHQRMVSEQSTILDRLASWVDMPLFDYDGTQTLVTRSWDELNNKAETSKSTYDLMASLLSLCETKTFLHDHKVNDYDALLELCRESLNALSDAMEMEQYCLKDLLSKALECGQQTSHLLLELDHFTKGITDFSSEGTTNELVDWQTDIHVWRYKAANFEKTELRACLNNVNKCLSLIGVPATGDHGDHWVKTLDNHVGQCMQDLLQEVETRWETIKVQLDNAAAEVALWHLKKAAERQWQGLLDSLESTCSRMTVLMSEFYHDSDPVMLSQEQDLMEAQQTLTTLAYETRPMLAMKANQVKSALDALATTWIDHADVDHALDGWEQTLQQHQQHLRHNISMCQYWVAAADVQGNLCLLEQLLEDGDKAKFKVYMDVLDTSLEKTRQAATLVEGSGRTEYALLMAKRNKLERQFNIHQRWLGTSTGNGLQRSRKISLPSKMPSQNLMGRTPNAYVADPQNDLDMEIGRIVNKVPYKVELNMVPGEAGRYRFGSKLVYCRILKSRMVMVRVGGGWTELSQFLRDHALLVGGKSTTTITPSTADQCQEMYLDTKRATSPTSGRPLLLPRMSQSSTTTTTSSSISDHAGYKDGDRYIAVDLQGYHHEMKMTPHDSSLTNRRYS